MSGLDSERLYHMVWAAWNQLWSTRREARGWEARAVKAESLLVDLEMAQHDGHDVAAALEWTIVGSLLYYGPPAVSRTGAITPAHFQNTWLSMAWRGCMQLIYRPWAWVPSFGLAVAAWLEAHGCAPGYVPLARARCAFRALSMEDLSAVVRQLVEIRDLQARLMELNS